MNSNEYVKPALVELGRVNEVVNAAANSNTADGAPAVDVPGIGMLLPTTNPS
jgi:hypothetical protein